MSVAVPRRRKNNAAALLVNILKRLQSEKKITRQQYLYLYPTTQHVPRIYGSPKVHKANCPLRPIVEGIGSVTYNVAKSLKDILRPIEGDPQFHVKDSKDFVNKLKEIIVGADEVLMSHDVVSLFTNVPIDKALEIIRRKLHDDPTLKDRTNLDVDDIIELLSMVLNTTYFQYNGSIYQQKFGAAMGGPCSPVVANIMMDYLFRKCQDVAPENVRPRVALKFVDDSFEVVKRAFMDALNELMNTLDETENLKFTDEKENEHKLAFLDSLVHRNEDGSLYSTVYRKPTHTDQYLHFTSHHPLSQRCGVIRTLMDRADNICTREADRIAEKAHVKQALESCGYPSKVIADVEKKAAQSRSLPKPQAAAKKQVSQQDRRERSMVTLPYVQGVSEKCRRIFSKFNIQASLRPAMTLRRMLVKPKDSRPLLRTSDCVYRIPCKDCNEVYIGETSRHLEERLDEHKASVRNAEKPRYTRSRAARAKDEFEKSALGDHVAATNHSISWDDASVLATHCTDHLGRKIRESICVRADKGHHTNRNEAGYKLPRTWDQFLVSQLTVNAKPVNANLHAKPGKSKTVTLEKDS